jgi:hypothetical protein
VRSAAARREEEERWPEEETGPPKRLMSAPRSCCCCKAELHTILLDTKSVHYFKSISYKQLRMATLPV